MDLSLKEIFDENFVSCYKHSLEWEKNINKFYLNSYCLKEIKSKKSENVFETSINSLIKCCKLKNIEISYDKLKKFLELFDTNFLCILQKNHSGKCCKKFNIKSLIDFIFSTPGNNDFIFKNRSSRLHSIKISDNIEKKLRNKNEKFKCAIPLKDASTPLMIATAYIDLISCFFNIKDINKEIKFEDTFNFYKINHFNFLTNYYSLFNRKIKNNEGYLCCPITGNIILIEFLKLQIDNENSLNLGHIEPRNNKYFTIRGLNILLMSRYGNLILGNHNFIENTWINNLNNIIKFNN